MATPTITEEATIQVAVTHFPVSTNKSLPCSPSLSPHALSVVETDSKTSIRTPKSKELPKNQNPPTKVWRYLTSQLQTPLDKADDTSVSIRRRFYSSDIILQDCSGIWTNFHRLFDLTDRCSNIQEEDLEPEPSAEWDRHQLVVRRRTCSETFTKCSRVPSSFFQHNQWGYQVGGVRFGREKAHIIDENEEHKIDDDRVEHPQLLTGWQETRRVKEAGRTGRTQGEPSPTFEMEPNQGQALSVEYDGQNLEKLRNLQKLFQEGFITVTEYQNRRVQLVDALSEEDPSIVKCHGFVDSFFMCPPNEAIVSCCTNVASAKTSEVLLMELPILYRGPPDFSLFCERDAIKHVFDSEQCTWTSSRIKVKIDAEPFAKGGLRQVFHLQDLSMIFPTTRDDEDRVMSQCTSYVAKVAIDPNENPDTYFKDVEMQAVAAKYAKLYNSYNPPRRVEFLEACILQLIPTDASASMENLTLTGTICGVEPFIEGEYHKHNNNFGYVSELERNTPQAFSHFTYEASGREILVVDIQGVGDHYTDPQIHTRRGKEFGKGNLALRGFERFLGSHRCNPICRYLKLPLINPKDEGMKVVDPKGTIPAETYMSEPQIAIDQVDSVLCHYYGEFQPFKQYKKRMKKKRAKQQRQGPHRRLELEQARENGVNVDDCSDDERKMENGMWMPQIGSRFTDAFVDQHRSCSSFACDGVMQCIVS